MKPRDLIDEDDDQSERKQTLPSIQRQRNYSQQKSEFKSVSALKKQISKTTALIKQEGCYWWTPPVTLCWFGLGCYKFYDIYHKMQKIFCEDLPRGAPLPMQGCWYDKSTHGISWPEWITAVAAVAPPFFYICLKLTRKPIRTRDVLNAAELGLLRDTLQTPVDSKALAIDIYEKLDVKTNSLKSIVNDRTGALTFFKGSSQIRRGEIFNKDISRIIADFLGCPDLPEDPRLNVFKKRN